MLLSSITHLFQCFWQGNMMLWAYWVFTKHFSIKVTMAWLENRRVSEWQGFDLGIIPYSLEGLPTSFLRGFIIFEHQSFIFASLRQITLPWGGHTYGWCIIVVSCTLWKHVMSLGGTTSPLGDYFDVISCIIILYLIFVCWGNLPPSNLVIHVVSVRLDMF